MDTRELENKIDAAADKAKDLASKLDEMRSEVAHKLEDVIAGLQETTKLAAKKGEHRLGEGLQKAANRVQEAATQFAHRAEEMANTLSNQAHDLARRLQQHKTDEAPAQPDSVAATAPDAPPPTKATTAPNQTGQAS